MIIDISNRLCHIGIDYANNFMNSPQLQSLLNFQLVKFQPNHILLRSRLNRKLYRYRDDICLLNTNPSCFHHSIISPIPLQVGALLECGYMNAQQLLHSPHQQYGQEQIVNTLCPILQALQSIHAADQVHGSLSAEAVCIDDYGEVKLFYPAPLQTVSTYYSQANPSKHDDFRAFAILVIQLMGCTDPTHRDPMGFLQEVARNKKDGFSILFILSIYFLLSKNLQYLSTAIQGFSKTEECNNPDLIHIYQTIFSGKVKKTEPILRHVDTVEFTPPLVKHQLSPRKVLQMTRKFLKVEDLENKKTGDENKKKKPSDTALKKMSNCKVEGENTTSPSYKKILRDLRETKERQDLFKTAVTVKRMRTISKKKIN